MRRFSSRNEHLQELIIRNERKVASLKRKLPFSIAYNSGLDISEKSGYNDNRIENSIHDVVTGGKCGNFI